MDNDSHLRVEVLVRLPRLIINSTFLINPKDELQILLNSYTKFQYRCAQEKTLSLFSYPENSYKYLSKNCNHFYNTQFRKNESSNYA